ncbi:energy transducer TonB [Halarcobacter sp.]|uniref:energy transducer TonB n=1 Tax=Halarcobacter sp. TaxID=2321133 RepID=UPI003A931CF3
MSRYFSSFFITCFLYTALFGALFLSFSEFKVVDKKIDEKKISLNFVEIKKQEKQIKQEKKPKKEVVKKVENKKENTIFDKEVERKIEKQEVAEKKVYNYEQEFLHKNLLLIQKQIQKHIKYSSKAKKLNIQGEVLVRFTLTSSGIQGDIVTLSGHRLLRRSTIKAIYEASSYFPKVSKDITIKLPIVYRLI